MVLGQHFIYDSNNKDLKIFKENEFTDEDLLKYANYIKMALELKIPNIVVHPDIYMCNRKNFGQIEEKTAEIICKAAKENNIPLEINLTQVSMYLIKLINKVEYPCKEFWKIALRNNVRVIYGIDAHYKDQIRNYNETVDIANRIISKEIIDRLNFCKEL